MLPFLCSWSVLVGRLSVFECAFWGFLPLFVCAVTHLMYSPVASLCNTGSSVLALPPFLRVTNICQTHGFGLQLLLEIAATELLCLPGYMPCGQMAFGMFCALVHLITSVRNQVPVVTTG